MRFYGNPIDNMNAKMNTECVKKVVASLTAFVYLGLSNVCLTSALLAGETPCHPAFQAESVQKHDCDHDADHDASGEKDEHHDSSSNRSSPCCIMIAERGVLLSTPKIAAAPRTVLFVFINAVLNPINDERTQLARVDHGPPNTSSQEVSLAHRAPRAPPALA